MNKNKSFNVLILGSGGREHALAWKVKESILLNSLYVAPGNSGTHELGENINININNYHEIKSTIITKDIHVLIIGPEDPLVNGLHDLLEIDQDIKGLIIIGPKKRGAKLEGSKSFAKKFMHKYSIPTARYNSFSSKYYKDAINYLKTNVAPYVIKADGLAAGKGVFICSKLNNAISVIEDIMLKSKFGEAGKKIVIEEFLEGIEVSIFILTDGTNYKVLPTAKDYKRIGENDTGLNTGGMGAVSPVPFVDEKFFEKIKTKIIKPTLIGLKKEKIEYSGFIFFGLIKVKDEPYVIEYNVRLGDPETQAIIPRIQSDLLEALVVLNNPEKFKNHKISISPSHATTVILTSKGYPEKYTTGHLVKGINSVKNCTVFHAGLKTENKKHITNGGRVLAITGLNNSIENSLTKVYNDVEKIKFDNLYFRKDIGADIK